LPPLEGAIFVRASPTRPRTVYVGNATDDPAGGVYLSSDGGGTFTRLPASPAQPFRLAAHPSRDGLLFVIGFDGKAQVLFRSPDGGATFHKVGPSDVGGVAFDPENESAVYLAAAAGGVYRSSDFGVTFTHLPGPTPAQVGPRGVGVVGVVPADEGRARIYIGTERGPYRSDDGGSTFKSISESYRGAAVNDLGIDAAGRLMVVVYHTVVTFRARTAGHPQPGSYDHFGANITTTQVNSQGGEWDGTAVAPSPVDVNSAVVATLINGVFSTTDGGATWKKATIAPVDFGFGSRVRATFAPSSASRVYLASPSGLAGLYRSDDAGKSFKHMFRERLGAVAVDPGDANVLYLGAFDSRRGLFKSLNGGQTVFSLGRPGNFSSLAIDPRHPQTIYAGNRDGGVLRSLNGGATWSSASFGLPPTGEMLAVAVDPNIPARVYAWVKAGGLFLSADGGGSWTAADTGEAVRRSGIDAGRGAMAVDRVVPGRVYLGNSGVVQIDTLADRDDGDDED
jgi:photosystem II stability/assembly factor-like uncharacterized protein